MKTLKINIDDPVYNRLKLHTLLRRANGGLTGIIDEFSVMIITAIEKGEDEVTLVNKKDGVRDE